MKAFWNEDRYGDEEDIYGENSREELVEGDELTPEEAGFMQGYMESQIKRNCFKVLKMDNYTFFGKKKQKNFDLGYGMVFVSSEDKMNDFIDKQVANTSPARLVLRSLSLASFTCGKNVDVRPWL